MIVRCKLDDLLLYARRHPRLPVLVVHDGGETFELERVEALYYELVAATPGEMQWLELAGYRLLKPAANFAFLSRRRPA